MISLAVVCNAMAPYREAVLSRIVRELPEVALWTIVTHEVSNAAWAYDPPAEIRPIMFGAKEKAADQSKPSNALREWRKGGEIIHWLATHNINAVLLEGYNDAGRIRIIQWCQRKGIPVMLWGDSNIRGERLRGLPGWMKHMFVSRILRKCSVALACGALGRQYFAKYGVSDDRIFYYPVEPDYEMIQCLPAEAIAGAQSRFALEPGRRRVVFSGRLAAAKRADLIIDAFAAIASARPGWDLVMMGDGPLRAALAKRVPAEITDRIIWTGFISEQETVSAVYRCCDVLVLPSDFEPWALAVNEGAAAGLAILASDVVGAAAELVREGINGFCFPAGNLKALTDCLLRATDSDNIGALKAGSATVLADWRRRGDPITGLREALQAVGQCISSKPQAQ